MELDGAPAGERHAPAGVVTRWTGPGRPRRGAPALGNAVRFVWEPGAEQRAGPPAGRCAGPATPWASWRSTPTTARAGSRSSNGAGESLSYAWNADNLIASTRDPAGSRPATGTTATTVTRGAWSAASAPRAATTTRWATPSGSGRPCSRGGGHRRRLAGLRRGPQPSVPRGGRPRRLVRAETRTLRMEHRSDGQPTRIERPYGGDSEFAYDALGRVRERRDRREDPGARRASSATPSAA